MRDTMATLIVSDKMPITNEQMRQILTDETPDSYYVETLPPSHDEERNVCFNRILGIDKVAPLVALQHDPVTQPLCERSYHETAGFVKRHLAEFEDAIGHCRWLDIELASFRAVVIDRFHLATSVATPLWERAADDDVLHDTERTDANRNIPTVLLRRFLREELHQGPGGDRFLRHFVDHLHGQELPLPVATEGETSATAWLKHQVCDLQWLLASFGTTARYLFPTHRVEDISESLVRVLGKPEYVFDMFKIPPPLGDPALLEAFTVPGRLTASLPLLRSRYQLYCTLLWRIVKAHRLKSVLDQLAENADHTVFGVPYNYNFLRSMEYSVQLFIDTHLSLFAWANGDSAWSDAAFYGGPGAEAFVQDLPLNDPFPTHLDIGRHSPIFHLYPHCRDVHPCESEMPDISSLILIGNNLIDINVKPSNPPLSTAVIHLAGCKLGPYRCQYRNWSEIVLRYTHGREPKDSKAPFVGYASIKQLLMLVLRCGLLGNWKACTTRAVFAERVAIEYTFLDLLVPTADGTHANIRDINPYDAEVVDLFSAPGVGSHPTRTDFRYTVEWNHQETFTQFIENNEMLCFHLFKEFHVNMFEYNVAFDITMSRYAQWGRYKNLMRAAMDNVRNLINTRGGGDSVLNKNWWTQPLIVDTGVRLESTKLCSQIHDVINSFHRMSKRCFIKLRKSPFFRMMARHMNLALSMEASGITPSGYARKGLAGDDDAELLATTGFVLSSTKDMMDAEPARSQPAGGKRRGKRQGGAGRRSGGAGGKRKRKRAGSDDEDEDDEDEEDEDEDEEDDEDDRMDQDGEEGAREGGTGTNPSMPELWGANGTGSTRFTADMLEDDDEAGSASDRNLVAIAKQLATAAKRVRDVDLDLMDMVTRDVMRRRQTTWRVETHWLGELFGVTAETLSRLRAIYSHYETFDMPDYQLLERSYAILKRNRRDFFVIHLYWLMLLWHGNQLTMPTSYETREAQLIALRNRWRITDWRPMPRDIGWAYYSAGSRRWFTTEAGMPRQKVDTARDRFNYNRDIRNEALHSGTASDGLLREAKTMQTLQLSRVVTAMQHIEKLAERVYSINMERTTYDDQNHKLYARRKKDPSLRRLKAAATLVDLQQVESTALPDVEELEHEINAVLAEGEDLMELETAPTGSGLDSQPIGGAVDQMPALGIEDGIEATREQIEARCQVLVKTADLTLYLDPNTRRQYAFLSDKTRSDYRTSSPAMQMLYDSSCDDPLIPVDLVGRLHTLNDKIYGLCCICGVITQFDNGKVGNQGLQCCLHDEKVLFKQNRRFLMYTARSTVPPTLDADRLLYGNSATAEAIKITIREENEMTTLECHFCSRIGRLSGHLANTIKRYRFMRHSKRDGSVTLETLGICERDIRFGGDLLMQPQKDAIDYAKAELAIQNNRLRTMLYGQARRRTNTQLDAIRQNEQHQKRLDQQQQSIVVLEGPQLHPLPEEGPDSMLIDDY